jgi:hypothetical protein
MQKIKNTGVLKALVVFSFISTGLFLLFQYTNSNNERSEPIVTAKTENKTSVIAYKTLKQDYNPLEESKTTVKKNRQKKTIDTTAPIITLLGNATENVVNGATYKDAGAIATDDVDGDITARIAVAGDTVNTAAAGAYMVTYNVSDAAGNAATEVTRTVIVAEAVKVGRITVAPDLISPRSEGFSALIQTTIFPYNATNKNVVWSSSNPSVATVVDGEVTIRDVNYRGIVIITATTIDGNKTATTLVSLATQAETRAFWSFNEAFRREEFDTFDLTNEEELQYLDNLLNSDIFDRLAANLPPVEGKYAFLEIYTSFKATVNAAIATFNNP